MALQSHHILAPVGLFGGGGIWVNGEFSREESCSPAEQHCGRSCCQYTMPRHTHCCLLQYLKISFLVMLKIEWCLSLCSRFSGPVAKYGLKFWSCLLKFFTIFPNWAWGATTKHRSRIVHHVSSRRWGCGWAAAALMRIFAVASSGNHRFRNGWSFCVTLRQPVPES